MSLAMIKQQANVFPINTESLKLQSKLQRHQVIIQEFSLNTSAHGIPGIARSQSIQNRLFWTLSFVIFTVIALFCITKSILAYFRYPTQTLINYSSPWPQAFPAVTICNYSPFRYDQFIGPYLNYTNTFNLTNTTDNSTFSAQQASYIPQYLQYKINRNESLNEFYYPLDSMLIKCVYNGANCSVADFVQFISSVYGLCYTFNAQVNHINNGKLHYNNDNGGLGQLELDLYVHSHQYVPYVSDGVGIVTMVHDNTQLPLIERADIQLIPGQKHKLGYTMKTKTFLPSPYTTCSNQVTPGMQAMFDQFSNATYAYAEEICFKVALQTYTHQECGCVSPLEWATRYVLPLSTTNVIYSPLCNVSDPCYSEAADRFRGTTSIWTKFAVNCGLECSSNVFVVKLSSVAAPPPWRMQDIKEFVESSSIPLPANWSVTWATEIQTNYVGVNVVCQRTQLESYTQEATISAVDVISNVGGQTGLWLGISFLSLMEVAEMLYRLIRHQCYLIRERLRNQRLEEETKE